MQVPTRQRNALDLIVWKNHERAKWLRWVRERDAVCARAPVPREHTVLGALWVRHLRRCIGLERSLRYCQWPSYTGRGKFTIPEHLL